MPLTYEEYVRAEKDKAQELKFKQVRTGLKLAMSKHIQETNGGKLEKLIGTFTGLESQEVDSEDKRTFLDDLIDTTVIMNEVFASLGDAEEGLLASKLTSISAIYMDKLAEKYIDLKLNHYPRYKEKFTVDMSEEQEIKNIVPRVAFKSIKMFLDKYYYVFRLCSVNPKAKMIYTKLDEYRSNLVKFEYNIGYSISKVRGDYLKQIKPFYRDTKRSLLMIRRFFEAVEDSQFGKLVKYLYETSFEYASRTYVKFNPTMTIVAPVHKGMVVPMQEMLDKFDESMEPIHQMVIDYDQTKILMRRRHSLGQENTTTYWDVSERIVHFKESMAGVVENFERVVSSSDNELKFFNHTIQTVIIPYINQSRGEVNETFTAGVKHLDQFFWKVTIKIIEMCQDDNEQMDEIAGLVLRLKPSELVRPPKDDGTTDVEISDSLHSEITK